MAQEIEITEKTADTERPEDYSELYIMLYVLLGYIANYIFASYIALKSATTHTGESMEPVLLTG